MNSLIENIITEAAMDSRIEDGVVDLYNAVHIQVIAETMWNAGLDENIINEFVEEFMEEGKYPDRQAYNKEGWLVTFPSKEYRDNAIKKGTHSVSDPTHGKGGMNLYYKKKGKQKRQTQQATSRTEEPEQKPAPTTPKPVPPQKVQGKKGERAPGEITSDMLGDEPATAPSEKATSGAGVKSPTQSPPESAASDAPDQTPTTGETPDSPKNQPAVSTPPTPAQPEPDYEEISKKFVTQKRWMPTPFGEYRDTQGNTVAVVGLSGEIVPIKNNDREEYKLFAEKNMPQP